MRTLWLYGNPFFALKYVSLVCWYSIRDYLLDRSYFKAGLVMIQNDAHHHCHHTESLEHVLMFCPRSLSILQSAFKWLGINLIMPPSPYPFLQLWCSFFKDGLYGEFETSLWFVVAWTVWTRRNKMIFNGQVDTSNPILSCIHACWFLFNCNRRSISLAVSNILIDPSFLLSRNWGVVFLLCTYFWPRYIANALTMPT